MHHLLVDLRNSFRRDAFPLLNCERLAGRFQLDVRSHSLIAEVNHGFQVQRVREEPDVRAQPAKETGPALCAADCRTAPEDA